MKRDSRKSSIIRLREQEQASLRLFCFPYAGAPAAIFRDWADKLNPGIEVWATSLLAHVDHRLGTLLQKPVTNWDGAPSCPVVSTSLASTTRLGG